MRLKKLYGLPSKIIVETNYTDCRDNPYRCGNDPYIYGYALYKHRDVIYSMKYRKHMFYKVPK